MRLAIVCLLFLATASTQSLEDLLISDDFGKYHSEIPKAPNIDPLPGCPSGSECVPYYLCKELKKDEEFLIDIHFEDDIPQPCHGSEICCAIENKVTVSLIQKKTSEGCGFRNPDGIGFKITREKGGETQYGEFPWMVAIIRKEQEGNQTTNLLHECGASVVSPGVVLTAAHCVDKKDLQTLIARAGEWDTQTEAELLPHQDRNVAEVVIHPDYYRGGLFNNIALLFLDVPFEIAENIKPICLPPETTTFDGLRCFATGWGKHTIGKPGTYNQILKKIDLPIVPSDTCQAELRKTRLGNKFELHNSFICAGGETEKENCKGDGGSPLVCPIPGIADRYYQAGIVSWGIGCGDAIPVVYANVAKLRPWIDEQLAYKKVPTSFYTL